MNFGVMFFSSVEYAAGRDRYALLKAAARFADTHQFCCIWTPERHFHEFGGLFPNAAVTSAALAMVTDRLQIRAGSVIAPLHDPRRIAEEWAVVDNLSNGRVAISFGSGWNVNDFVFFPDRYRNRQAVMYEHIDVIQRLWRGEAIEAINGLGRPTCISISPRPIQPQLPIWITSSGHPDTFVSAGAIGANVLTHLLGQDLPALQSKIALYREARAAHGFQPREGIVSVMLHTFIGPDEADVRATVYGPFGRYLRAAVGLERASATGGGVISGGRALTSDQISREDMDDLLDVTFERYYQGAALMGTPERCAEVVRHLEAMGVDEIACLIDFGVEAARVLESLTYVNNLSIACASAPDAASPAHLAEFLEPFAPDAFNTDGSGPGCHTR
jgi:phthiocerol/phenolphthiocerol synthesis type-I polyketide synthase D